MVSSVAMYPKQFNIISIRALRVKVDLGARAMKEYTTFIRVPGLEFDHQTVQSYIQDICEVCLQRWSRCILLSQPAELQNPRNIDW